MSYDPPAPLVESLLRPAAYPYPVKNIELLQTHISWVLLTGEFTYKVKKPVSFGFVDFSTLERRRFFCDEELRLNRRLAPELYLDVLPIAGPVESARIGGEGMPIEYCVRMQQFEQERLLSRLAAEGKLLASHIDELVREVSEFHTRISAAEMSSRFGTPESVAKPIRENFKFLDSRDNSAFRETIERLHAWCENELTRHRDAFVERKNDGFTRECHGDMHLGNMILPRWENHDFRLHRVQRRSPLDRRARARSRSARWTSRTGARSNCPGGF